MAKYIDADTVVSMPFLDDSYGIEKHTVEADTIENLLDRFTKEGCPEPADVAKIIRCENCQYHSYDEVFCCYWCEHEGMVREVKPDFYCGYGEE